MLHNACNIIKETNWPKRNIPKKRRKNILFTKIWPGATFLKMLKNVGFFGGGGALSAKFHNI